MRNSKYTLLFAVIAVFCLSGPVQAENVTADEAEQIANNWISMIIHYTGSWGGHTIAEVSSMVEFKTDDRLLGYYCTIEPSGFIVVSLIKGLAPVKTYSGTSTLDPEADDGPTALFKFQMERVIRELELQIGPVPDLKSEDVEQVLVYKHLKTLEKLKKPSAEFMLEISSDTDKRNYIQEDSLLTSRWHQGYPYNWLCPDASANCDADNCNVGCVATAAAQIMRYWSWPPGRPWGNMPDFSSLSSPFEHIEAVAELCSAVGAAVGMDYCHDNCQSSASTSDMESVYEDWSYDDCELIYRRSIPLPEIWWDLIKPQLNANRPIQYKIEGHSIVLDGWREWHWGDYEPEYHMNYGWNNGYNAWYALDDLHQVVEDATFIDEYMVLGIVPAPNLGPMISGTVYYVFSPYLYVDRDCVGIAADFQAGHLLQFLPGVTLLCGAETVRFSGFTRYPSVLYTPEPDRGIRIDNGAMVFYPGGGIRFQQSRPGP